MLAPVKRVFFYFGWGLLAAAFVTGAAEPLASSTGTGFSSLLVPAYDLWYAVAPHSLVITQIRVEKISFVLWDPVIVAILTLPAWFLLGVPGGLLTWFLRPYREISDEMREDLEHYRESLLIIETLSRDAREDETFDPNEDDNAPVHLMFDLEDHEGEDDGEDPAVRRRDKELDAGYPSFDEMEEWHRPLMAENDDTSVDELPDLDDDGQSQPTPKNSNDRA